MKEDNRGFTLVELVICMVIFAIVVAAAFGFMISGSRSYGSVTERLNLQLDSQLAMNQLGDYIIDCNAGLYFETDLETKTSTLYILNKGSSTTVFDVHVFQLKSSDNCIYYGFKEDAAELASSKLSIIKDITVEDLLAENVTKFTISTASSDNIKTSSALVTINFKRGNTSFNGEKIVALRNKPANIIGKIS